MIPYFGREPFSARRTVFPRVAFIRYPTGVWHLELRAFGYVLGVAR